MDIPGTLYVVKYNHKSINTRSNPSEIADSAHVTAKVGVTRLGCKNWLCQTQQEIHVFRCTCPSGSNTRRTSMTMGRRMRCEQTGNSEPGPKNSTAVAAAAVLTTIRNAGLLCILPTPATLGKHQAPSTSRLKPVQASEAETSPRTKKKLTRMSRIFQVRFFLS